MVDKPMIQYVVEEAASCDVEQIIVVTSMGKGAVEDHFDRDFELEYLLEQKGEKQLLEEMRRIAQLANICYIRQKGQIGLGHAVLAAKELVGNEPFAVFLPDDIFDAQVPVLNQMLEVYQRYTGSVVAVRRVAKEESTRYGIIRPRQIEERVYQVLDVIEKPEPEEAPSELAIVGRYILTPEIFAALEITPPDKRGEIQLSDGLKQLVREQAVYGYEFEGKYYDGGEPLGLLKATVELALTHPETGADFKEFLRGLDL